jgi:hypothetical protein
MAHPLRQRNFRILFAGRVVDALGDAVSPVALTLAVVTATRSSAGLAVILVCGMLPRVALLPVGGVVVDRLGARRVALTSDVVSGLGQLAIGLLLLAGHLAIAPVAVAAAISGAASWPACPPTTGWYPSARNSSATPPAPSWPARRASRGRCQRPRSWSRSPC